MKYDGLDMEIIRFSMEDIITASDEDEMNDGGGTDGGTDGGSNGGSATTSTTGTTTGTSTGSTSDGSGTVYGELTGGTGYSVAVGGGGLK